MKIILLGFLVLVVGCAGPWMKEDGTLVGDEERNQCGIEVATGKYGYGLDPMTKRSIMESCLYQKGYRRS